MYTPFVDTWMCHNLNTEQTKTADNPCANWVSDNC